MNSRKFFPICLLIVLIIALVTGCGHNPPSDNYNPPSPIAKLDLSNATTLAIVSKADVKRSSKFGNRKVVKDSSSENLLFKILPDGTLEEVQLLDANGNPISYNSSYNPVFINNINENYILVCFGVGYGRNIQVIDSYLVRKSDGAVFSLANAGQPYVCGFWGNIKPIQTDINNNIYYQTHTNNSYIIMKIDTQDVNNLTGTIVSTAIDNENSVSFDNYLVDPDGNIIYEAPNQSTYGIRLVHASGQFEPIISCNFDLWLGLDNKFYYIKYDSNQGKHIVYKINITGPNVGQYEQQEIPDNTGLTGYSWVPSGYNCNQVTVGNKIFRISNGGWGSTAAVYEIYNGTDIHKENLTTNIKKICFSGASNDYYYLCGVDVSNKYLFAKVDTDGNVTEYTDPQLSGFEVYSMTITGSGEIIFNGYKYTGEKIIGKIDADGTLVSEDISLDTTVIQLERIQ